MHIRAGFGAGDLLFAGDQLFLGGLLELYPFRLGRATTGARLLWAGVARPALRTSPFQFDVTQRFPDHMLPSPIFA